MSRLSFLSCIAAAAIAAVALPACSDDNDDKSATSSCTATIDGRTYSDYTTVVEAMDPYANATPVITSFATASQTQWMSFFTDLTAAGQSTPAYEISIHFMASAAALTPGMTFEFTYDSSFNPDRGIAYARYCRDRGINYALVNDEPASSGRITINNIESMPYGGSSVKTVSGIFECNASGHVIGGAFSTVCVAN